ncbi:MAG: hypothetical protein JNG83_13215 [Opitutaceae bacterium]|nr:hypothetical protein [Opitutaceae bacterium]
MNPGFLVLANVLLLTRLVCLFRDDANRGSLWAAKAAVELAALGVLYPCSRASLAAAAVIVAFNLLGWRGEKSSSRKNFLRLRHGLLLLVCLSFCFAPGAALAFRPGLVRFAAEFADWTALGPLFRSLGGAEVQLFLFGLLLTANEANLAIRAVFDWLDLKPRSLPAGGGVVDVGEFNRGRVIGMLERALLYVFLLQGQYGAIGFVLAAKAFTRFKALDDRPFAEYVLIGTLLSACCALGVAAAVRLA